MREPVRFYDRERMPYGTDRRLAEEYANWLKQVPWRFFSTFTFAWVVSDPQATKTFDKFINRLECYLKCDIGYVRGDEKRFSGCGQPACARHFHALLACAAPVAPEVVEALWMSMAGNRSDGAGALVEPYDPNQNGASYVLKFINQPDGDWAFRKLHLFLPVVSEENVTKRMRRHLRRHHLQVQEVGSPTVVEACNIQP